MRCYFMRDGHIEAVEELPGLADDEAIAKAHALFAERRHSFEGFELWERSRVLVRHPEQAAANSPGVWPLQKVSRRTVASGRPSASQFQPLKPPLKA
jgi:hypothetical protein